MPKPPFSAASQNQRQYCKLASILDYEDGFNVKAMKMFRSKRGPVVAILFSLILLLTSCFYISKLKIKQQLPKKSIHLNKIHQGNGIDGSRKELSKRSLQYYEDETPIDYMQDETTINYLQTDEIPRNHLRMDELPRNYIRTPSQNRENLNYFNTFGNRFTTNKQTIDDVRKANYVRGMMLHAWNNYKRYAWGHNELAPITKSKHNQRIFGFEGGSNLAATIIDSLDTLWIMGLNEQYEEARWYVKEHFDIRKVNSSISVFETNIRFLGGMLAAYALTHDPLYLEKAEQIGDVLLQAFSRSSTPLPYSYIIPSTGKGCSMGRVILAEIGTLHLEFYQLSLLTNNDIYLNKVKEIRNYLHNMKKMDGLYANELYDTQHGWASGLVSLGAEGDSFYEYLLKAYIQSGERDEEAWIMYNEVTEAVKRKMVRKSRGGLVYIADWFLGTLKRRMSHLACFSTGMFALQSMYEVNGRRRRSALKLAEDLANTCHESYVRTPSRIGPDNFHFDDVEAEAMAQPRDSAAYLLRPEVVEGFFYLWRLTKKRKYKEWVWDAVKAINQYCKVESGFAGLNDVYHPIEGGYNNVQHSFFLAETLKYMYLTFMDDMIPLDDWVFNTEAHPLPIIKNFSRKRGWRYR